jgi:hypothetical protein
MGEETGHHVEVHLDRLLIDRGMTLSASGVGRAVGVWLRGIRAREPPRKPVGGTTAATATFPVTVRENEEVVPVNAVSTWVLPSGVTVGR